MGSTAIDLADARAAGVAIGIDSAAHGRRPLVTPGEKTS
jgi:hypothetical protein